MTYTGKLFWQQVGIGHWALVIAPHTPDASPKGRSCANKLAEPPNAKAPLNPLAASGEGIKGSFGGVGFLGFNK
ncbi:hypothetical protein [Nostoc sp.]